MSFVVTVPRSRVVGRKDELLAWMIDHGEALDYMGLVDDRVSFFFRVKSVALLFKLTWGGHIV